MWIEPVKKRIQSLHLEQTVDSLESAGLITDLISILRRSKNIIPPPNSKDLVQVLKILTEEIWNEHKKPVEAKPEERTSAVHSRLAKSYSINDFKQLTSVSKISTPSATRRGESMFSSTSTKYKQQVSQDVAYMSTFSFPKGSATFYKTRRLTSDKIPEVPGPGAYFCDPKMAGVNNSFYFGINPNSTISSRRLSLSVGKY